MGVTSRILTPYVASRAAPCGIITSVPSTSTHDQRYADGSFGLAKYGSTLSEGEAIADSRHAYVDGGAGLRPRSPSTCHRGAIAEKDWHREPPRIDCHPTRPQRHPPRGRPDGAQRPH